VWVSDITEHPTAQFRSRDFVAVLKAAGLSASTDPSVWRKIADDNLANYLQRIIDVRD